MTSLITGGTGLVGAELAHLLVEMGEEVVVFNRTIRYDRIGDIKDEIKAVSGDLGNWSHECNQGLSNYRYLPYGSDVVNGIGAKSYRLFSD
jgi:nucleoside-diphosphate-sugar epimerase